MTERIDLRLIVRLGTRHSEIEMVSGDAPDIESHEALELVLFRAVETVLDVVEPVKKTEVRTS